MHSGRLRSWANLVLQFGSVVAFLFVACPTPGAQVDPAVLEAETARVAIIERASSAAVAIFADGGQGGGSGVVISADGYALSNFHVTHECGTAMKCGMADGKLYDAVIVGLDPTGDVALVKLLGREDFPHAELGDSDKVQAGDWCLVIGNPFLLATDFRPTVSYGVISGTHRYQYPSGTILEYADCLQADAAINPGNSGGPMFDAQGRLIGINGRGSFEKRGRVNVGVGYAISINQIKNFLGHLRSGRLVDHATLGARVRSGEGRRVVVDDILEESDAFRRGLRYGDEVLHFGDRDITSVNAFKNVLGIFPKGWRVPLAFNHRSERVDVLVRLRGVHREAELAEMMSGRPKLEPREGEPPRKPGEPMPPEKRKSEMRPAARPIDMPEIVKNHYIEKSGYVNFYFNQIERDRVWKAHSTHGELAARGDLWTLEGNGNMGEAVQFDLSAQHASIKLPSGELKIDLSGSLAQRQEPPQSGGLLVALSLWRRLLVEGPEKFGEVYYLGTVPVPGREKLADVLVGSHSDVECHFLFDSDNGQMVGLEMLPEEDTDPCELAFGDFKEAEGVWLPCQITARHGDDYQQVFRIERFKFGPTAPEGD